MKTNRTLITLFIFFIAFSLPNSVSSQETREPKEQGRFEGRILADLNLDAEQRTKIREINRKQRPKQAQAVRALGDARRDLDRLVYTEGSSEAAIQEAINLMNRAQAEITSLRIMTEYEISKVLRPEQLKKFREIRFSRMSKGPRWRQPGPRGPRVRRPPGIR